MKYVILIHSNPHFLERWEALTDEQRAQFGRRHYAIHDELAESGELVASEGLADPALGKWIDTSGAETIVMDGPFAEVKEHLAGFYLVDCDSEQRAVEIAAQVPDAVWGLVEVRPVLDRRALDL